MGEIIIDSGFGFLKSRELTLMFIAALGAIISMPLCRTVAVRLGLSDNQSRPITGGISVSLFALCMVLMHINRLLMAGVFLLAVIGMVNDRYRFGGWFKLAMEAIVCGIYLRIGYGAFYPTYLLHLLLMLAIINSMDLLDGIDGLPIPVFIVAFIPLALMGWKIFITSICGALIVLYYYNVLAKSSKIALGDGTSLALGFMIAGLIFSPGFVMYGTLDQASWYCALDSVMFVLLILPYPLIDMTRTVIHRAVRRRRPTCQDNSQLHVFLYSHGVRKGLVSVIVAALNVLGFVGVWLLMDLIEMIL